MVFAPEMKRSRFPDERLFGPHQSLSPIKGVSPPGFTSTGLSVNVPIVFFRFSLELLSTKVIFPMKTVDRIFYATEALFLERDIEYL